MTTLGKYIGGGMSFGAFGGNEAIMSLFDPRKPNFLPHAGTFNNNVLTMSAGIAGLSKVYTPEAAHALNERGETLRRRLNDISAKAETVVQFTGRGSMMNIHFTRDEIRSASDVKNTNQDLRGLFFFDMLERGIYFARRGMLILSLPVGDAECDRLVEAVQDFLVTRAPLLQAEALSAA